jgi:hypothetical protein
MENKWLKAYLARSMVEEVYRRKSAEVESEQLSVQECLAQVGTMVQPRVFGFSHGEYVFFIDAEDKLQISKSVP